LFDKLAKIFAKVRLVLYCQPINTSIAHFTQIAVAWTKVTQYRSNDVWLNLNVDNRKT